tara:strand:- start:65515 stop:66273 length:759 start_codon:yes stop_codon:yes gene_type:complete
MKPLSFKLISIHCFLISFLTLIQAFLFYYIQGHSFNHIGHASILVIGFVFFLLGYFYHTSKVKEWLVFLFLPILFAALTLKVLWTGGLYSPFLPWLFLITFQTLYWVESRFFKVITPLFLVLSLASLLYFIKLEQMNFAHLIFKLTPINYFMLYLIPFCSLSFFFIADAINFHQFYEFNRTYHLDHVQLTAYAKLFFKMELETEVLDEKLFKLKVLGGKFDQDFMYHLNQLGYQLDSHFLGDEYAEILIRKI